jgi:hypothetical protein
MILDGVDHDRVDVLAIIGSGRRSVLGTLRCLLPGEVLFLAFSGFGTHIFPPWILLSGKGGGGLLGEVICIVP